MTLPEAKGPYTLNESNINSIVDMNNIGAYSLGPLNTGGETLTVKRVGRSDVNLNKRLKDYIGDYSHFVVRFCASVQESYETECKLYHKFNPSDNAYHPDKPTGTNYSCPVTGCPH